MFSFIYALVVVAILGLAKCQLSNITIVPLPSRAPSIPMGGAASPPADKRRHHNFPRLFMHEFCIKGSIPVRQDISRQRALNYQRVDVGELIRSLEYFKRPPIPTRQTPLDVELTSGKFLRCGSAKDAAFLRLTEQYSHCRTVLATAIFGNRDVLPALAQNITLRLAANSSLCAIAFLDGPSYTSAKADAARLQGWTLVQVPPELAPYGNARIDSRLPKILLPLLFPRANVSIWVDGKLALRRDPRVLVNQYLGSWHSFMTLFAHHPRISWVEESEAVLDLLDHVDPKVIEAQRAEYQTLGIPSRPSGLPEGAAILRDHRHLLSRVVSCLWWNEYTKYPPRDQTSLVPSLFMAGFRNPMKSKYFIKTRDQGGKQLRKLWFNFVASSEDIALGRVEINFSLKDLGSLAKNSKGAGRPAEKEKPAAGEAPRAQSAKNSTAVTVDRLANALTARRRLLEDAAGAKADAMSSIVLNSVLRDKEETERAAKAQRAAKQKVQRQQKRAEEDEPEEGEEEESGDPDLPVFNVTRAVVHIAPRCAYDEEFQKIGHRRVPKADGAAKFDGPDPVEGDGFD